VEYWNDGIMEEGITRKRCKIDDGGGNNGIVEECKDEKKDGMLD
jgi:hypothetical protein